MKTLDAQTAAWVYILIAGVFEVGFTTAMALVAKGQQWAWWLFAVCAVASFTALQEAIKVIPIGIGYAVWTGIGAAGTLLVSALVFKTPISGTQLALVALLIATVVGLKLTGSH
jgi:quaternary ammonium compound-resistance protein SugE